MNQLEPRDHRRPGHFWADNEIVEVYAAKIGVNAFAVYMVLAKYANADAQCWPSTATIARQLGIGKRTVVRAIHTLRDEELITIEERSAKGKGQISHCYTLLHIGKPAESTPMPERHRGYATVARAPMPERHPNNTNKNNTQTNDVRHAAMKALGLRTSDRRKVLAAQPDLTLEDIQVWQPFYEKPPPWCNKPVGYMLTSLVNGDPPPDDRTNGRAGVDIDTMTSLQIQALVNGHYE